MKRYAINGEVIEAAVFASKCYECGMPTLAANEWHPYEACAVFKATSSSDAVMTHLRTLPKPWEPVASCPDCGGEGVVYSRNAPDPSAWFAPVMPCPRGCSSTQEVSGD